LIFQFNNVLLIKINYNEKLYKTDFMSFVY
jgi:hypothetical protein